MTHCEDTRFFDYVLCEKTTEKHKCQGDDDCHVEAKCNLDKCICNPGYDGDGFVCSDIDECKEPVGAALCAEYEPECKNTQGRFYCRNSGNVRLPYSEKLRLLCESIGCDRVRGAECVRKYSTAKCRCEKGFITREAFCLPRYDFPLGLTGHGITLYKKDLSYKGSYELIRGLCIVEHGEMISIESTLEKNLVHGLFNGTEANSVWLNGPPVESRETKLCPAFDTQSRELRSFDCASESFLLCEQKMDRPECESDSECAENATCRLTTSVMSRNTGGTWRDFQTVKTCLCDLGFRGNGTECADVDECAIDLHTCDGSGNGTCVNTIGSYFCG